MKKPNRISKEELIYQAHIDKEKHVMDVKLRERGMWAHYLFQSLLATLSIFLVLLVLQLATPVIVAALGATAFVCYAMPKNVTAQPRNVIGGHFVGVISGGACALLFIYFGDNSEFIHIIFASISVGVAIFIMVVTDTEHPPGCSTALGLVVHALAPLDVALYGGFIIISATIIALVKHALDPQLKDLV
jgi:CBS-domain-containing membrane protein